MGGGVGSRGSPSPSNPPPTSSHRDGLLEGEGTVRPLLGPAQSRAGQQQGGVTDPPGDSAITPPLRMSLLVGQFSE